MKKIVFLGSDGSGKSTFINFMKKKLESEKKTVSIHFMGWRDFQNPIIKRVASLKYSNQKQRGKGDNMLERYHERSWAFYAIYYLELWTRYLKAKKTNKDFLLMDRYFYDELAFSGGLKFNILSKITPKPDICVILKSSISTMKKRGYDYSKKEFERYYSHLEKINAVCKTIVLDSSTKREVIFNKLKPLLLN